MPTDLPGRLDSSNEISPLIPDSYIPCPQPGLAPGDDESPAAMVAAARTYVAARLSVIPIAADGSKSPSWRRLPRHWDAEQGRSKHSWKIFQARPPRDDELDAWLSTWGSFGLAVVGGGVSAGATGVGLEIIDIDTIELAQPWIAEAERRAPGLMGRLVRIRSPRPGLHVYYRCRELAGSQKLACAAAVDEQGQPVLDSKGRQKKKTLIEVKGDGGYCVVPPSPGACHASGRHYQMDTGSRGLTEIPIIAPQEREVLLGAARTLNRWHDLPRPLETSIPTSRQGTAHCPRRMFTSRCVGGLR